MTAALALSILDFQHPGASVALACAAEEHGFSRFWLGEHHSPHQCANPLLLGALLAGTTSRIRIGTGGVSLTYHSPLCVVEDARLIEFMLPGRFDLGVTRGLLEDGPVSEALLDGRRLGAGASYADRVRALHGLLTGRLDGRHPLARREPYLENGPPLWVLGLSSESARLAGRLGVGFCFSVHHGGPRVDGAAVMRAYRESFVPSAEFTAPASMLVLQCVCAGSEAEARSIGIHLVAPPGPTSETILGSAAYCCDRLAEIARAFVTDEVMIVDFIQKDQGARIEMYRLLAQELGLGPHEGGATELQAADRETS
jgi:luciferase family oxidoreductase group 1